MKNKCWRIDLNKCEYDQYGAFIVMAKTIKEAVEIARKENPDSYIVQWSSGYKFKEITEGLAGAEFHAG